MSNLEYEVPDLSNLGISYEVDDPTLCTTAEIEKYYTELKQSWEIGIQQADAEGNPISREYSELTFSGDTNSLDLIQLNYYSEEYEGDKYYRLTSKFYETEYYSARNNGFENFTKWEISENEFLQEIIYKHTKTGEVKWDRDYNIVHFGATTNNEVEVPEYTTTESTNENTGIGLPVRRIVNGRSILVQWSALQIPYKRIVNCGNALGAVVSSDGNFKTYLKSSPTGVREEVNGVIVLRKQYLEIEFSRPTEYLPTYVKVEFYGSEMWRSFAPIKIDNESEIIIHNNSTPEVERYKPPGRNDLPDNFWNNRPLNQSNYENFVNRQGVAPSWGSF